MTKTIKYIGSFFLLFGLFLTSTFFLESCKGKGGDQLEYEETDDSEYSSDEEIYDEYFESDEEASAAGVEVNDVGSSEVDPEYKSTEQDVIEYEEDFSFEASDEEKASFSEPTNTAKTSTKKPASTSSGSYLVVAGSYLIMDNAEKMVKKLKNLGYSGAEVVNFDESKYHSISAGRFNSYDDASEVVSALKNKGIDCYVHTRK